MFHPQLWELFKGLLNRKDLLFLSLSLDTIFEMTDGFVTALVARFEDCALKSAGGNKCNARGNFKHRRHSDFNR